MLSHRTVSWALSLFVCVQLCAKEFHTILFKTQRCRPDANSCGHHWFFVCTVLGASLMIWWIFQVYPARKLAFRCDSVLPRVRAFPSWPFVLFMGPLWNSSQLRVENFLVLSLSLTKFVGLLLSKIIQPWHIRDQFAVQIQLAILLSVCRSSSCGPT